MTSIFELKEELSEGCTKIYQQKLVKLGEGNLSLRIPNKTEMIITPSGNNYLNPLAEKMVHLDFKGTNFDAGLTPSSEYRIHRFIYEQRPKVQCILHTHSPYACALSLLHRDLPVIIEEMALFIGGSVRCAEFASAGSEELPQNALIAMENRNAVILANHGSLIVGKNTIFNR